MGVDSKDGQVYEGTWLGFQLKHISLVLVSATMMAYELNHH